MGAWCVTKLEKNAEKKEFLAFHLSAFLKTLRCEEYAKKKVCVVAIAGESRRGKSFFVNMTLRFLQWSLKNPHVAAVPHKWMLERVDGAPDTEALVGNSEETNKKPFAKLLFLSRNNDLNTVHGIRGWSGRLDEVLGIRNENNAEVHERIDGLFRAFACCRLASPGRKVTGDKFDGNPEDMEIDFRDGLDQAIKFLLADLQPKCVDGRPVPCGELATFLEQWATAFESIDLPQSTSIFQASINAKFQIALERALAAYKTAMEKKADGAEERLDDSKERERVLAIVRGVRVRAAAGEHEKHERLLAAALDREFERLDAINRSNCQKLKERKERERVQRVVQHYQQLHNELLADYRDVVQPNCRGERDAFETIHEGAAARVLEEFARQTHPEATVEEHCRLTAQLKAALDAAYANLRALNEAEREKQRKLEERKKRERSQRVVKHYNDTSNELIADYRDLLKANCEGNRHEFQLTHERMAAHVLAEFNRRAHPEVTVEEHREMAAEFKDALDTAHRNLHALNKAERQRPGVGTIIKGVAKTGGAVAGVAAAPFTFGLSLIPAVISAVSAVEDFDKVAKNH
ncbi:GB1/RHD3-type G domain-containing protein [Aphelenchoides fujianensis]|nr:GB1/RHD3-type G domain-containing protein [Aphelenchoides fujianensis]